MGTGFTFVQHLRTIGDSLQRISGNVTSIFPTIEKITFSPYGESFLVSGSGIYRTDLVRLGDSKVIWSTDLNCSDVEFANHGEWIAVDYAVPEEFKRPGDYFIDDQNTRG